MTRHEQTKAIEQLGYTQREADFLYVAARNSGFFLSRQFNWFLRRKAGALTQAFADKLRRYEHADIIDYGQSRFVFHIKSRTIYRALGIENSQNRRAKSDQEIRMRLMILDYLLEFPGCEFLSTEQEKTAYFSQLKGVTSDDLPRIVFQSPTNPANQTVRHFVDRFPISVHEDAPSVRFTYFDAGELTARPFCRFLESHEPLLAKIARFELVYVALSGQNLTAAQRQFSRMFPELNVESGNTLLPLGSEHLKRFFRAEQLWNGNSNEFRHEDLAVLREGEQIYARPEHTRLRVLWTRNSAEFDEELARIEAKSRADTRSFRTLLLEHSYPIYGYKVGRG